MHGAPQAHGHQFGRRRLQDALRLAGCDDLHHQLEALRGGLHQFRVVLLLGHHSGEGDAEVRRILAKYEQAKLMPAPTVRLGKKRRVLVAEDDARVADKLRDAMTKAGYDAEIVQDGSDAVGKAILTHPDVVALKGVLSGLNGDAVAAMLKEIPKTRTIPVILYDDSGWAKALGEAALHDKGVQTLVPSTNTADVLAAVKEVRV